MGEAKEQELPAEVAWSLLAQVLAESRTRTVDANLRSFACSKNDHQTLRTHPVAVPLRRKTSRRSQASSWYDAQMRHGKTIRLALSLGLLSVVGCGAERAVLLSEPPHAKVYIDEKFVGMSPASFLVGRWDDARYRVVLDGYKPAEGELQGRLAPGRVAATVFTFGIYTMFSGLYYYPPTDVDLSPSPDSRPQAPIGTPTESPEDRLRHVQTLHDQHLIDEQEYERMRSNILRELDSHN
jgi:hypothetical protein